MWRKKMSCNCVTIILPDDKQICLPAVVHPSVARLDKQMTIQSKRCSQMNKWWFHSRFAIVGRNFQRKSLVSKRSLDSYQPVIFLSNKHWPAEIPAIYPTGHLSRTRRCPADPHSTERLPPFPASDNRRTPWTWTVLKNTSLWMLQSHLCSTGWQWHDIDSILNRISQSERLVLTNIHDKSLSKFQRNIARRFNRRLNSIAVGVLVTDEWWWG